MASKFDNYKIYLCFIIIVIVLYIIDVTISYSKVDGVTCGVRLGQSLIVNETKNNLTDSDSMNEVPYGGAHIDWRPSSGGDESYN